MNEARTSALRSITHPDVEAGKLSKAQTDSLLLHAREDAAK